MIALVLGVLMAATPPGPPPGPSALEQRALHHIHQEFERIGRRSPHPDPALTQAARELARKALERGVTGAVDLVALTEALSDAGGADPSPRSYVVRAGDGEMAVSTLEARRDLNQEPASHVGVGMARQGTTSALVVLLAERKASLRPFPRVLDTPGQGQTLCGDLLAPLRAAEVYVTLPDGRVEHPPLTRDVEGSACTRVLFPVAGRYTVELVGRGERGPEVAALFLVDVATSRHEGESEPVVEPTDIADARAQVLERINALRRAHKLQPLVPDEALTQVAQAYSERMAREGFFAHVSPDGQDLRGRLNAAGVRFRSSGENLGMAAGPLAAHFGIELSPGHRGNLLGTPFTQAGIGVAFHSVDGRPQVLLTELFSSGAPVRSALPPVEEMHQVLAGHRAAHGLAPLKRLAVLDAIAQEQARRALAMNLPPAQLPGDPVHERVFNAVDGARSASVDFYVTDSPAALPDARSLGLRENTALGVGAVQGDSPTLGKDRYWVVVIYAATRTSSGRPTKAREGAGRDTAHLRPGPVGPASD